MNGKRVKFLGVLLAAGTLLTAGGCGGGGAGGAGPGNGAVVYQGRTTPANVNSLDASKMASFSVMGYALYSGYSTQADALKGGATLAFAAKAPSISTQALQSKTKTVQGQCGGSQQVTIDSDEAIKWTKITILNTAFCNGGETMNGSMEFEYSQPSVGTTQFSINFIKLITTGGTEPGGIDGSIVLAGNQIAGTLTVNLTMTDTLSNSSAKIENYNVEFSTIVMGTKSVTMSGRLYDSAVGYVDITTPQAFLVAPDIANPYSGQLVMTGANNQKLRITAQQDALYYMLEKDAGSGYQKVQGNAPGGMFAWN